METILSRMKMRGGVYTFKDTSGRYENDGGAISTDGGISFCWTQCNDENALYYQAYASSRATVDKLPPPTKRAANVESNGGMTVDNLPTATRFARQAANSDIIEFNAGRLMFARAK